MADKRVALDALMIQRIEFALMPDLPGLPLSGVEMHFFPGQESALISTRDSLLRPATRFFKVVFDIAVALLLCVLLAPLFVLFAALILLDGGPVLYSHLRVGQGGRPFRMLKFRTMVVDSETVLKELLTTDPASRQEWEENFKLRKDPRVTAIGRLLRATSLDELPQLINVLKGEMSLVGPRPIIATEAEKFGEEIGFYHSIRPGMTGLWQVSGRNSIDYGERVRLNTWYVKNWSLWLDLTILLRTIPVVFGRRDAY